MTATSLNYVSEIDGLHIVVRCEDDQHCDAVRKLGARRRLLREGWKIECQDDAQLASVLSKLRDFGFSFAGAPSGWPPAAVFEQLRSQGLATGNFREVTWRAANEPETRVK